MVYSGDPLLAEDLLFKPEHSLIEQSLHSTMGATTTNGDGFGIGWYGLGPTPAVFKNVDPAWNDRNLRELAAQVRTPLFFAHVRASTGTPVQRSNCHPFRHDDWLWMHNGAVFGFHELKRDLVFAVDPSLYPDIEGSTDSEVLFFLALTFGLEDDPMGGVARAFGFVEDLARRKGVSNPHPGDDRHDGRTVGLGLPLLLPAPEPHPLPLDGGHRAAPAAPRGGGARGRRRRREGGRVGAAARPARSLARGAGVVLRHHPGR